MKAVMRGLLILSTAIILSACSSNMFNFNSSSTPSTTHVPGAQVGNQPPANSELGAPSTTALPDAGPITGSISSAMDSNDKSKLNHALDNGVGKSSQWTNQNTKISYTVTPTRKLSVGDNPYCREYSVTATRGGSTKEKTGTACVSADSSWQTVR